jgi:hypothetical protein
MSTTPKITNTFLNDGCRYCKHVWYENFYIFSYDYPHCDHQSNLKKDYRGILVKNKSCAVLNKDRDCINFKLKRKLSFKNPFNILFGYIKKFILYIYNWEDRKIERDCKKMIGE